MITYNKDIIKYMRIRKDESMDSVAKKLKTSRQRYSRFEENPGSFDLDFIIKVLNVLEIDKDLFFLN